MPVTLLLALLVLALPFETLLTFLILLLLTAILAHIAVLLAVAAALAILAHDIFSCDHPVFGDDSSTSSLTSRSLDNDQVIGNRIL